MVTPTRFTNTSIRSLKSTQATVILYPKFQTPSTDWMGWQRNPRIYFLFWKLTMTDLWRKQHQSAKNVSQVMYVGQIIHRKTVNHFTDIWSRHTRFRNSRFECKVEWTKAKLCLFKWLMKCPSCHIGRSKFLFT